MEPVKMPECHGCREDISDGTVITASKEKWHPKCFKCSWPDCKQNLRGITFFKNKDGKKPLCQKHYEEDVAEKCKKCDKPVVGEIVSALGVKWHPKCFICKKCETPLKKEPFKVKDNHPYCKKDYEKLFQEKPANCEGCNGEIDDSKWIEAMGHSWHYGCFRCSGEKCEQKFDESESSFIKQGDKAYCKKCIKSP